MALEAHSYYTYRTPHGPLTVEVSNAGVCMVSLSRASLRAEMKPTELSNLCANELLEYFAGKRMAFDLPLDPQGTPFQRAVWDAIGNIPYGQTRTNAEIAATLGCPSSYRMVGAAVKKNPLAVLIPAHRVVNASGKIAGSDKSADLRRAMLELERRWA